MAWQRVWCAGHVGVRMSLGPGRLLLGVGLLGGHGGGGAGRKRERERERRVVMAGVVSIKALRTWYACQISGRDVAINPMPHSHMDQTRRPPL